MNRPIVHTIRDHAFVASVSIAAFTHSSWSLATVFGGHEPNFGLGWAGWIIPAALIAGSIDIGLLSLATQIQDPKERNIGRIISFVLLAAGMFALQGLYVASHMPVIPLAEGVRAEWAQSASLFRDSMLIVVPGLLPLALILHTISGSRKAETAIVPTKPSDSKALVPTDNNSAPLSSVAAMPVPPVHETQEAQDASQRFIERTVERFTIACDICDWADGYDTPNAARMALIAHKRVHIGEAVNGREKEGIPA